jgi:hypothetical protein
MGESREMGYICKQRSYLRGFFHWLTILTEGSMQDNMEYKTTEYKSTDSRLPPVLVVMYCVRVSLRTIKYYLRNTKEKGVEGNLYMYISLG